MENNEKEVTGSKELNENDVETLSWDYVSELITEMKKFKKSSVDLGNEINNCGVGLASTRISLALLTDDLYGDTFEDKMIKVFTESNKAVLLLSGIGFMGACLDGNVNSANCSAFVGALSLPIYIFNKFNYAMKERVENRTSAVEILCESIGNMDFFIGGNYLDESKKDPTKYRVCKFAKTKEDLKRVHAFYPWKVNEFLVSDLKNMIESSSVDLDNDSELVHVYCEGVLDSMDPKDEIDYSDAESYPARLYKETKDGKCKATSEYVNLM